MTHRIVVLGAGYAGLAAAKRTARQLHGTDARVTLINAADRFVERVRLHQLAAGQALADLPLRDLLKATGVELVVASVTAIDDAARTVCLSGAPHTVGYDTLVYALGSRADVDTVAGVGEHAFTIADADGANRLRSRVAQVASAGGVLAVVGGGLTGIEAAAELADAYPSLRVNLVTGAGAGAWLSARAQRHLRRAFDRIGIVVRADSRVSEVGEHAVVLEHGARIAADAIVWAAGFQVPPLAERAGFAVDERGRMMVDETLRSVSHPDVYAVGDAAAAHTADGNVTRMSCQAGLPMGRHVADVVAGRLPGRDPRPFRLRYVWQNISLGRRDGVTQFTHGDDSPNGWVLTGRLAASFKEVITRGTVSAMRRPGPYLPARRPRAGHPLIALGSTSNRSDAPPTTGAGQERPY